MPQRRQSKARALEKCAQIPRLWALSMVRRIRPVQIVVPICVEASHKIPVRRGAGGW